MADGNSLPTMQADFTSQPKIGKSYYNTAFLPKTGNIDGSWWDPSYYMFFFTLILIIINTVYVNVKTSGAHLGRSIVGTLFLFVITYFFTRSSSCLWAGGCQVFAIFNLLFPFIMIILAYLLEDMSMRLYKLSNINYPEKIDNPKPKPKPKPKPVLRAVEPQQDSDSDSDSEDNLMVDVSSNMVESFSSYYPY